MYIYDISYIYMSFINIDKSYSSNEKYNMKYGTQNRWHQMLLWSGMYTTLSTLHTHGWLVLHLSILAYQIIVSQSQQENLYKQLA